MAPRLTPTPPPTITSPAASQGKIEELTLEDCQAKANELLTNYLKKSNATELAPYVQIRVSEIRGGRISMMICPNFSANPGELTEKRDTLIRRMLGELKGAYPEADHVGQSVQFKTLPEMGEFLDSVNRAFEQYRGG